MRPQTLAEFGVITKEQPTGQKPPAGELGFFYHIVPGATIMGQSHEFHTDQDTPDKVPWTALEAATRRSDEDWRREWLAVVG